MLKRKEFRVYRFKTINNTIIYVGYTGKEMIDRFLEHSKDKYWINDVAEVEECIIENEGQARIVEIQYINMLKPLFNKKDKFPGAVFSKLRTKDKKFSHSFYVLNGQITTCVPKTKDDYTLVHFLSVQGQHIGQYYDGYLNLYYSATDICNILKINKKELIKLAKKDENFIKTSYDIYINGKEQTENLYLCTYQGVEKLLINQNDISVNAIKNLIEVSEFNSNIFATYPNLNIEDIYNLLQEGLANIEGNNLDDNDIKRRLIYKAIIRNMDIKDVVHNYNNEMAVYNLKAPIEPIASDIFSMIEDLLNEYGSSYKEFLYSFNKYLLDNYDINFWSINAETKKKYKDTDLQAHYVIAVNRDVLYELFFEFYEECFNKI